MFLIVKQSCSRPCRGNPAKFCYWLIDNTLHEFEASNLLVNFIRSFCRQFAWAFEAKLFYWQYCAISVSVVFYIFVICLFTIYLQAISFYFALHYDKPTTRMHTVCFRSWVKYYICLFSRNKWLGFYGFFLCFSFFLVFSYRYLLPF